MTAAGPVFLYSGMVPWALGIPLLPRALGDPRGGKLPRGDFWYLEGDFQLLRGTFKAKYPFVIHVVPQNVPQSEVHEVPGFKVRYQFETSNFSHVTTSGNLISSSSPLVFCENYLSSQVIPWWLTLVA